MAPSMLLCRASASTSVHASRGSSRFVGTPLRLSAIRRTPVRAQFMVKAVDQSKVLEDVRSIIAEQLGTDLGQVVPESKFVDLGADSLDTVEIMMALEEKFGLQLDEEGAEKISTVQEAADLIAKQVK